METNVPKKYEKTMSMNVSVVPNIKKKKIYWIKNPKYQALLIALVLISAMISILSTSWIPIIIGVITDVIGIYYGKYAEYQVHEIV